MIRCDYYGACFMPVVCLKRIIVDNDIYLNAVTCGSAGYLSLIHAVKFAVYAAQRTYLLGGMV